MFSLVYSFCRSATVCETVVIYQKRTRSRQKTEGQQQMKRCRSCRRVSVQYLSEPRFYEIILTGWRWTFNITSSPYTQNGQKHSPPPIAILGDVLYGDLPLACSTIIASLATSWALIRWPTAIGDRMYGRRTRATYLNFIGVQYSTTTTSRSVRTCSFRATFFTPTTT